MPDFRGWALIRAEKPKKEFGRIAVSPAFLRPNCPVFRTVGGKTLAQILGIRWGSGDRGDGVATYFSVFWHHPHRARSRGSHAAAVARGAGRGFPHTNGSFFLATVWPFQPSPVRAATPPVTVSERPPPSTVANLKPMHPCVTGLRPCPQLPTHHASECFQCFACTKSAGAPRALGVHATQPARACILRVNCRAKQAESTMRWA
jgi:hypothetical protein